VLVPLAIGLAFGALALWAGLTYSHDQAALRAQAVPATAVIDQVYAGPPTIISNGGTPVFDQYGIVRFAAGGQTAHARVLLVSGCLGVCGVRYQAGQKLLVYYSPQNLTTAQLHAPGQLNWTRFFWIWFLGIFAGIFLAAAAVNTVTAWRERQ
jgi:hypothetical protein